MGLPFFTPDKRTNTPRYEVVGFNMSCTVRANNTADAVAEGVRVLERVISDIYRWPLVESE